MFQDTTLTIPSISKLILGNTFNKPKSPYIYIYIKLQYVLTPVNTVINKPTVQ